MGLIILPELVKKRETSLPLSAKRAMVSAETGFFLERVFFIEALTVHHNDQALSPPWLRKDWNKSSVRGLLVITQSARRLMYDPCCAIAVTYSSGPSGYLTLKFIVANSEANDAKSSAVKCTRTTSFLRMRVAVILSGAA